MRMHHGVTPHVGVWIETKRGSKNPITARVTPHVGVWIETISGLEYDNEIQSHTSCRCVD